MYEALKNLNKKYIIYIACNASFLRILLGKFIAFIRFSKGSVTLKEKEKKKEKKANTFIYYTSLRYIALNIRNGGCLSP